MNVLRLRAFRTRAVAQVEPHKLRLAGRGIGRFVIGQLPTISCSVEDSIAFVVCLRPMLTQPCNGCMRQPLHLRVSTRNTVGNSNCLSAAHKMT
jgi:hypothetical protein